MLFGASGGAGEWGAVSRWLEYVVRGALGADGRGHNGVGVCLPGRGIRMGMGTGCVDGVRSGVGAGVSGVWAGIQISMVRCGIFFIDILAFQKEFAPSDAKRPDVQLRIIRGQME